MTGASGDLATVLVRALAGSAAVDSVKAFSRHPLRVRHKKVTFVPYGAISELSVEQLRGVECLVHTAYVVEEPRDKRQARKINVEAVESIVELAVEAGVGHVIVLSSINAYGDTYRAGQCLDESVPVQRTPGKFYFDHKAEMELRLADRSRRDEAIAERLCVVRPTYVVGPDIDNSGIRMFRQRVIVYPEAATAAYQFLHQDDFASAIMSIIEQRCCGIFNLGPRGYMTVRDIAERGGHLCVSVPLPFAERAADLLYRFRISTYSSEWVTIGEATVTSERLERRTGWQPMWSCAEAASIMLGVA
ncbi:NAD-dependent epimerase/dehydratase family protein [Nocardia ninae]|uniref:NAD-dependent epimerase/dehydratase family protein n=1 Tax=Nocardia ninae TaxID=356145 RepID=UPI001649DE72|nr:NAD-dependent epimerase/dehydratase family protein [Nocardia ninae]